MLLWNVTFLYLCQVKINIKYVNGIKLWVLWSLTLGGQRANVFYISRRKIDGCDSTSRVGVKHQSINQSINQSIMDVAANSTISHFFQWFIILFYKFGTVNTYLTPPLFIEVFVPNLKSDPSCICVLPFFDWILKLFPKCGISCFSLD